jgi:hypothetical protein
MYHAVVDVSCGCAVAHPAARECTEYTGVLASGGYASTLVHLQSRRPDGDFRLVSVLAPPTSFNPHLVIAPDHSYFALYFRVNAVDTLCVLRIPACHHFFPRTPTDSRCCYTCDAGPFVQEMPLARLLVCSTAR